MTNEQLLTYAGTPFAASQCLTVIQRQELYCLRRALEPMPCPVCATPVSLVDASGLSLNEYPAGHGVKEHRCPQCKSKLIDVLPFQGPAYWRADTTELQQRLGLTPTTTEDPASAASQ
jgi:hypothetical protein